MPKPLHNEFMDDDMRDLWNAMTPLPDGLRLYGGTALALYLNHRYSTDFDFVTPDIGAVDIEIVDDPRIKPWLGETRPSGGPGMVDVIASGPGRDIQITFMECGGFIPVPRFAPVPAANGVLVADPRDLIDAKYKALVSRGSLNEYKDAAAFIAAWPDWALALAHQNRNYQAQMIVHQLSNPPLSDDKDGLTAKELRTLREFCGRALGGDAMADRGKDGKEQEEQKGQKEQREQKGR